MATPQLKAGDVWTVHHDGKEGGVLVRSVSKSGKTVTLQGFCGDFKSRPLGRLSVDEVDWIRKGVKVDATSNT